MKRLSILLLVVLLACPCLASAESSGLTWYFPADMSDADLRLLRDLINVELSKRASGVNGAVASVVLSDCLIEVVSIEKTENHTGAPSLLVACRFTNNSTDATTMMRTADVKMFQNSVQLDSAALIHGVNLNESTKEVKPGGSLVCYFAVQLQDKANAVDLEIKTRFGTPTEAETLVLTYTLDK